MVDLRQGGPASLTMSGARHDFGLGRAPAPTYCYQSVVATPTHLGPTIVAQSGTRLALTVANGLGGHPLAEHVDEGLHGCRPR